MTLRRTALWAAVLSAAALAGGSGAVSVAQTRTVVTPEAPWQVAQGPRRRDAEDDEERRKGRDGRENRREEKRDGQGRSESQKDAGPPAKAAPGKDESPSAVRRGQSDRKDTPPRIEARPPVQPKVLNKDAGEKTREMPKAKQKDAADEKRDGRADRRDDRKDVRDDRRDDRRDTYQDRKDSRVGQPVRRIEDIQRMRRQRVDDGGRTIIEEPDKRIIVREKGRTIIRHDETERFRRRFQDARTERLRDGGRRATFIRSDGMHIISEYDAHDRLLRRYRRHRDGRIVVLIDNRRHHRPSVGGLIIGAVLDLSPPVVRIPREKYIVDYEDASYDDIYEALSAPPIEDLERDYSLDEVRYNYALRARMRRIDLNTINFDLGSWEVAPDQYPKLEHMARAINRLLERNPDEIILIEGHTDAVGPDDLNLTLSDRRAEEVAAILSEEFGVPPENLVTQGYGEQFLKVDTQEPERENRRVALLRITPLLSRAGP